MSSSENLSPQVIQRIIKEVKQLATNAPDGIRYIPNEDENLSEIHVEIQGPEDTPYDGGYFKMKLVLIEGFPQSPPKGYFLTKIYHPNIATNGDICVNTLKRDWTPDLGITHVLQVIRCLLIVPFPESSLNDEAGRLFMDSYDEYARRARLMTSVHAPKVSCSDEQHKKTAETTKKHANLKHVGDNNENIGNGEKQTVSMKRKPTTSIPTTASREKALTDHKKAIKKRGLKRL